MCLSKHQELFWESNERDMPSSGARARENTWSNITLKESVYKTNFNLRLPALPDLSIFWRQLVHLYLRSSSWCLFSEAGKGPVFHHMWIFPKELLLLMGISFSKALLLQNLSSHMCPVCMLTWTSLSNKNLKTYPIEMSPSWVSSVTLRKLEVKWGEGEEIK